MIDKKTILLVEPDWELQKTIMKTLEKSGYRVITAGDGQQALDTLSDGMADLIISALRMPNIDGIEFMEEIRRINRRVPVIFITAYGEVESYMDLMNMGAFDYLNKPVKERDILRVAGKALEDKGGLSKNLELSSA